MRCMLPWLLLLCLFDLSLSTSHAHHGLKKSPLKDALVLPLNEWSSQRVLTRVIGNLAHELDVDVKYQQINSDDQWGAMRLGIVHLQIEVWGASIKPIFHTLITKKQLLDMGLHTAQVREEWWYPEYVETLCPGLPDWQALNRCSNLFAVKDETQTVGKNAAKKGVYYIGPWEYEDAALIRALKLNFVIRRLPDGESLWKKLRLATAQNRPIVLLNWTPNWSDVRSKGKFIEFPPFTPQCESKPEWGLNPELTMDCGNPKSGWLKKAAWPGLKKRWPCIYQLLKNINLTNEMIAEAAALVVNDGLNESQAALLWQYKYQQDINHWLNFTCNQ